MKKAFQTVILTILISCLSNNAQADKPDFIGYSCSTESKSKVELNEKNQRKLDFALDKLSKDFSTTPSPKMERRMALAIKDLSQVLGRAPTGDQLYQFFKQIKDIKKEYKDQGGETYFAKVKRTKFRRWVSFAPDRDVVVTFDDAGKMYLVFQPKVIGKGGFKSVQKAVSYKNWEDVAMISPLKADTKSLENFCKERSIAESFCSKAEGLIPQLGANKKAIFQPLYQGDISKLINSHGPFTYAQQLRILEQVSQGLKEIQAQGYAHNDIKSANIFYRTTPAGPEAVLGDYGLLNKPEELISARKERNVSGSLEYMAPELILGWLGDTKKEQADNAVKADVYSLGLVAASLMIGRTVFQTFDPCFKILEKGRKQWKPFFQCKADQTMELQAIIDVTRDHLLRSNSPEAPGERQLLDVVKKSLSVHPKSRLSVAEFNSYVTAIENGTFDENSFASKHRDDLPLEILPKQPKPVNEPKGISMYCW
ncbi:MAG: protein kinase [Bdellovibrionia bacterium]